MASNPLGAISLPLLSFQEPKGTHFAEKVKRIDPSDLEYVEILVNRKCRKIFGDVDVEDLLDRCFLSLSLFNPDNEAVALLCTADHPNIPSIPPWEWGHWVYNLYGLEGVNSRNTLWIHLVAWDDDYVHTFLDPLLKALFSRCAYLHYVIMVVPPGAGKIPWLQFHGTKILPKGQANSNRIQKLHLYLRQHYVGKYKIRRAVVEDNDDIVALINTYTDRLQNMYGQFYIAELLLNHPDCGRQIIVAENEGTAVAVLCLNEAVNYDALNKSFELLTMYGLRKPCEDDVLDEPDLSRPVSMCPLPDETEDSKSSVITHLENSVSSVTSVDYLDHDDFLSSEQSVSSLDEFTIVNVSSLHIIGEDDDDRSSLRSGSQSEFSAIVLAFNEYEMHLYSDKQSHMPVLYDDEFEDRKLSKLARMQSTMLRIPTYRGRPNAFSIEIAASHPEHECEAMCLLLEAAFDCFPDRDYCIMTTPSTCPPFPVLELFVRMVPRPTSTFPHELYVLHRNTIIGSLSLRVAVKGDMQAVEELTARLSTPMTLLNDFYSAVYEDNSAYYAFMMLSEGEPIGCAVLKAEKDFEYLRTHYKIMSVMKDHKHKPGSIGVMEHFLISPIFQRMRRFFLRELHRLSDFFSIFYRITPEDTVSSLRERALAGVIGELRPIRPRIMPEVFKTPLLEDCMPSEVVTRVDEPFALFLSTPRLCSLPKFHIHHRLVVIGASDTAMAFLESLICTIDPKYLVVLRNVTVVAPHGLAYQKPPCAVRDMLFVTRSNLNHRYMQLVSLRTFVNIVNGVLTSIDRKNKFITVSDDMVLPYDMLFLMCGQQYSKPPTKPAQTKETKPKKLEFPENVFIINTEVDATNALIKLKELTSSCNRPQYNVIVYGYNIEAYCCLAALLEFGIRGSNIVYVEPFPVTSDVEFQHQSSFFNDGNVDDAVQDAIRAEGITVHTAYYYSEWVMLPDSRHRIYSARFESKHKMIEIECLAMFMYHKKEVSMRTFLAINRAGLVFDGALVISSDCKTNDPFIYAAGTFTKYSRKYYADHLAHKYYNLEEIGYKLGKQIRIKLLPFAKKTADPFADVPCMTNGMLVPRYQKPLITYCSFPGGLKYLNITKPGKQVPLEVAMSRSDYGRVFVTGDCQSLDRQGFFRLHLNQYNAIETITCLTKFDIDKNNLISIWGLHEKLLNNLVLRFEMALINDFYDYFREPWTCAIYHDSFQELMTGIKELMSSYTYKEGESLIEDLSAIFKHTDWKKLTRDERDEIEEKFTDSPYHKGVEKMVLDFLKDYSTFLPMYAHPDLVEVLLQGCQQSPLFQMQ